MLIQSVNGTISGWNPFQFKPPKGEFIKDTMMSIMKESEESYASKTSGSYTIGHSLLFDSPIPRFLLVPEASWFKSAFRSHMNHIFICKHPSETFPLALISTQNGSLTISLFAVLSPFLAELPLVEAGGAG